MRRSEASIFDLGQTEALESDDMSPCPDANASPAIKLSSHRIPPSRLGVHTSSLSTNLARARANRGAARLGCPGARALQGCSGRRLTSAVLVHAEN